MADLRKARSLLGYEPRVPLEEGVARAVAWFREDRASRPDAEVPIEDDAGIGWKSYSVR